MRENPNYDPALTAGKAAQEGGVVIGGATIGALVGSLVVNSLRQAGKAPWGQDLDGYAVTIAASAVAAVAAAGKKALRNIRKHRWIPLLALVALSLALAGCVTTTAPDGTVTQQVDVDALSTAWARYEEMEARRDALEAERDRADAQRRAEIEAEIRALLPELERAAQALGARLGQR